MSIRWLSEVWDHSPYKGSARLVHLALADNANDEGECFPHLPTVIRKSTVSRPVVYRVLRQMMADGLLKYDGEELSRPSRECPFLLQPVSNRDRGVSNRDDPVSDRDTEAGYTSYIEPSVEPSVNRPRAVTDVTEFDYWYSHYPKKVGKGAARTAFIKARKKIDMDRLVGATIVYAASRRGQDKRYTLNPTTWLNQERWDDEVSSNSRVGVLPDAPMPEWMKRIAKEES